MYVCVCVCVCVWVCVRVFGSGPCGSGRRPASVCEGPSRRFYRAMAPPPRRIHAVVDMSTTSPIAASDASASFHGSPLRCAAPFSAAPSTATAPTPPAPETASRASRRRARRRRAPSSPSLDVAWVSRPELQVAMANVLLAVRGAFDLHAQFVQEAAQASSSASPAPPRAPPEQTLAARAPHAPRGSCRRLRSTRALRGRHRGDRLYVRVFMGSSVFSSCV